MRRSLRSTTQTVLNVNEWAHKLRDAANDDEGEEQEGARAGVCRRLQAGPDSLRPCSHDHSARPLR
jgi:hypothetical protein